MALINMTCPVSKMFLLRMKAEIQEILCCIIEKIGMADYLIIGYFNQDRFVIK